SLVHIDDLGEAYALALERGRYGETYFISDDAPVRRHEFITSVARDLRLPPVPSAPGWLMGVFLGYPMVEAVEASMRVRNEKAKRELGWRPRYRSYSEGLAAVLRELRDSLGD